MQQRAQQRVGQVLRGKWRLDSLLGLGGMAAVYAASHRNGKRAAIKMLHSELSCDQDSRERFLREGYVANKVDHPGSVSVLDDDVTEDGCAFLVMELLEGETLEERRLRKGGRLPTVDAFDIAIRLLGTLAAAHDAGIVHRDLKPENVFLTKAGGVKVLDFGIARIRDVRSKNATQEGSAMGTPAFMPPEQARGRWEEVDARSDLWAIGAILFTVISGEDVHRAETVQELMLAAMTVPARSLASVCQAHPSVVGFVDRALAFKREDRFADARAMQAAAKATYQAVTGHAPASLEVSSLNVHAHANPELRRASGPRFERQGREPQDSFGEYGTPAPPAALAGSAAFQGGQSHISASQGANVPGLSTTAPAVQTAMASRGEHSTSAPVSSVAAAPVQHRGAIATAIAIGAVSAIVVVAGVAWFVIGGKAPSASSAAAEPPSTSSPVTAATASPTADASPANSAASAEPTPSASATAASAAASGTAPTAHPTVVPLVPSGPTSAAAAPAGSAPASPPPLSRPVGRPAKPDPRDLR